MFENPERLVDEDGNSYAYNSWTSQWEQEDWLGTPRDPYSGASSGNQATDAWGQPAFSDTGLPLYEP